MGCRRLDAWPIPPGWNALVFDRREELDEHLVAEFLVRLRRLAAPRVVLASGATFAGFFAELRRRVDGGRADLSAAVFTHLDEFLGVDPFAPGSLSREIRDALFPDADPRRGRFAPVDARRADAVAAHEALAAGADLALLGVGRNGHVAFNEPGSPFGARTRLSALAASTREQHRAAFAPAEVPREALTAGLGTILSARELIVVASGAAKADAVRALLEGALDPSCPASALRLHDRVTLLLDAAAAPEVPAAFARTRPYRGGVVRRRADLVADGPTLVVAPHPDDASISCGGFVASLPRHARRVVATFSTGARAHGPWRDAAEATAVRESESSAEAADLGAEIRFLRAAAYDSGVFDPADAAALSALLDEIRPARVFAPAREDRHPTHRLCRLTVEEALRGHLARGGGPIELWTSEGPWSLLPPEEVDVLFVVDDAAADAKGRAMARHDSQMARVPFDDGARALERLRAVAHSESHLGGKKTGGFEPGLRIEAFRVERLSRID